MTSTYNINSNPITPPSPTPTPPPPPPLFNTTRTTTATTTTTTTTPETPSSSPTTTIVYHPNSPPNHSSNHYEHQQSNPSSSSSPPPPPSSTTTTAAHSPRFPSSPSSASATTTTVRSQPNRQPSLVELNNYNNHHSTTSVVDWDEDQVNQFFHSLGLNRLQTAIQEHGLTGDVLIHLDNALLKDIGIQSVGKRLTILKAIYKLKLAQHIPIEDGHWVPPLGDLDQDDFFVEQINHSRLSTPTTPHHDSISKMIEERDLKINLLESEIKSIKTELQSFASRLNASNPNSPRRLDQLPPLPPPPPPPPLLPPSPLTSSLLSSSSASTSIAQQQQQHNPIATSTRQDSLDQIMLSEHMSPPNSNLGTNPLVLTPSSPPDDGASRSTITTGPSPTNSSSSSPSITTTPNESSFQQDLLTITPTPNPPPSAPAIKPILSPPAATVIDQPTSTQLSSASSSSKEATIDPNNPYKSFRVTLEDPCYKVLPAALKKYKIKEHYKNYVLFICYGKQERCLSYEEKPLLLFQKLKEADQNPVFTLRHIKDIESPISIALSKQAQRRDKKTGDKVARKGPPNIGSVQVDSGFCIAIYPYMSEIGEDFDVGVGDTFFIVGKSKGWWAVTKDEGTEPDERKKVWIPSGCLIETNKSFTSGKTGKIDDRTKIEAEEVLSVCSSCVALMDYKAKNSDELSIEQGDLLKVYKKYNNWSYSINESKDEKPRGWTPSWLIGSSNSNLNIKKQEQQQILNQSSSASNTPNNNNNGNSNSNNLGTSQNSIGVGIGNTNVGESLPNSPLIENNSK